MNWKTTGFKITKKLLYYALVIVCVIGLGTLASNLMNEKDTIQNIFGFVLTAGTVGLGVTFLVREIQYFFGTDNNKTNNKTNE